VKSAFSGDIPEYASSEVAGIASVFCWLHRMQVKPLCFFRGTLFNILGHIRCHHLQSGRKDVFNEKNTFRIIASAFLCFSFG
jgi:hypothetical protein